MNFGIRFTAWFGRLFARSVRNLPPSIRYRLGDMLGILWFDVFRIRRQVVLNNLKIAFPDWSEAQRIQVGRASLRHMGQSLIEYCELPFIDRRRAEEIFEIQGREHLDRAIAQKRGVCLLTLHLGNGDLATAALSLVGYPMYLISKEFKVHWLNELWFGMRARLGTHFIPPRQSSYAVLRVLKKGSLVIFVQDQFTGPPIGAKTRFFGKETGTGIGLSIMSQRSQSPVIPVYTYRKGPERHVIVFGEEIGPEVVDDPDESLVRTTQKQNDVLEKYVRLFPEQWMWLHKRWKLFKY